MLVPPLVVWVVVAPPSLPTRAAAGASEDEELSGEATGLAVGIDKVSPGVTATSLKLTPLT